MASTESTARVGNDGQGQSANWKSYHQPILSAERSKRKQVGGGILHLSLH
jgi:hypothetical protein